jgi:hypothetical protein
MIRPIRLFFALFMTLMLASCSCGIYGHVYRSAAKRIDAETICRFAKEANYRRTSNTEFKRGSVYLHHNDQFGDFTIHGSFCPLPWELIATSPDKVSSEVEGAETEAKEWFRGRGINLAVVPSEVLIDRNSQGEQDTAPNRP